MERYYRSLSKAEYQIHRLAEKMPIGTEWSDGAINFHLEMLKSWVDKGENLGSGGISSGIHDIIICVDSSGKEFRLKTYEDIFKRNKEYDNAPVIPERFINIVEIPFERIIRIYDPRGMEGTAITDLEGELRRAREVLLRKVRG